MSFVANGERQKLKVDDRYTPSYAKNCEKNTDAGPSRQGVKRCLSREDSYEAKRRKEFTDSCENTTDTPAKNIANSRLQRLKQVLKSDLQEKKDEDTPKPNSVSQPTFGKAKNIYENLDKWATPQNLHGRSPANSRLKRLSTTSVDKSFTPTDFSRIDTYEKYRSPLCDESFTSDNRYRSPLLQSGSGGIKHNLNYEDNNRLYQERRPSPNVPSVSYQEEASDVRKVKSISVDYSPSDRDIKNNNKPSSNNCTRTINTSQSMNISNTSLSDVNTSQNSIHPSTRFEKIRGSYSNTFSKSPLKFPKDSTPPSPVLPNISSPTSPKHKHLQANKAKILTNIVVQKPDTPPKHLNPPTSFQQYSPNIMPWNKNGSSDSPTKVYTSNLNTPFSTSPKPDSFIQNRLMNEEDIDSYWGKMALTASWVEYHTSQEVQATAIPPPIVNEITSSNNEIADTTEEMEWANAEPDEELGLSERIHDEDKPPKHKDVCIVVDTNIFISHLSKLREIVSMKPKGHIKTILYIPWMVITELDYMKDTCSKDKLKSSIMDSIKFINSSLQADDSRVIGQTVAEAANQKLIGSSPDDKIISCCLQVAMKYETVILLSNDMNLKNKALINSIMACSVHEILEKVNQISVNNKKTKKIMQKMSILSSSVICECARDTYGTAWSKMHLLSDAPWSMSDCLKRFKKYWETVFKDKMMKHFNKTVDDFYKFIKCNKCIADDTPEFLKLTELCITMCIFFKEIAECKEFVEKFLRDLKELE